jgi:hypothetical protein
MELLEKVLGAITGLEWVSSTQSYRLSGPPNTFISGEVRVSRGRLCRSENAAEVLTELHDAVQADCDHRMPDTMHALMEMYEEHTPA